MCQVAVLAISACSSLLLGLGTAGALARGCRAAGLGGLAGGPLGAGPAGAGRAAAAGAAAAVLLAAGAAAAARVQLKLVSIVLLWWGSGVEGRRGSRSAAWMLVSARQGVLWTVVAKADAVAARKRHTQTHSMQPAQPRTLGKFSVGSQSSASGSPSSSLLSYTKSLWWLRPLRARVCSGVWRVSQPTGVHACQHSPKLASATTTKQHALTLGVRAARWRARPRPLPPCAPRASTAQPARAAPPCAPQASRAPCLAVAGSRALEAGSSPRGCQSTSPRGRSCEV